MSRPPESAYLLPAALAVPDSGDLAGRAYPEPPHAYRTPFARDSARVLHARAFRRLAGKTQVFTRLPGGRAGDHFRSRLTHTLEVTQIARTLAAALGLNAALTEALALVHDIGHPPFGHAGEKRASQTPSFARRNSLPMKFVTISLSSGSSPFSGKS